MNAALCHKLPVHLSTADARLPQTYENARAALEQCVRVDECKSWADKMEVLAAYFRMQNDDTLEKLAVRIKARATCRIGELLNELDARGGDQSKKEGGRLFGRKEAAREAGLSEWQAKTAVRIANIPKEEREAAIESDDPPTITQLAQKGTKPRSQPGGLKVYVPGKPPGWLGDGTNYLHPREFSAAMHLVGDLERAAKACREHPVEFFVVGVDRHKREAALTESRFLIGWLTRFIEQIEAKP